MSEQAMPVHTAVEDDWSQNVQASRTASARRRRQAAVNISEPERLVSAVAGGFFAIYGVRRKGWAGLGLAALGAELLRRGMTGHCMAYDALGVSTRDGHLSVATRSSADVDPSKAVKARAVETIQRPRAELYRMWRDFSQLPRYMVNLQRVDVITPTRSHWVTKGPAGATVEWDAEIIAERENEYIEWQSVEPAEVPNRGTVQFVDAAVGGGTEVIVTLEAQPPAGKVGDLVARAMGKSPQQEVTQALHRFKQIAEGDQQPPTSSATRAAESSGTSRAGTTGGSGAAWPEAGDRSSGMSR